MKPSVKKGRLWFTILLLKLLEVFGLELNFLKLKHHLFLLLLYLPDRRFQLPLLFFCLKNRQRISKSAKACQQEKFDGFLQWGSYVIDNYTLTTKEFTKYI